VLKIILKSVGILFLYSGITYGHGGGVDSIGGHNNKKTGEYHCQKELVFLTTDNLQTLLTKPNNSNEWLAHYTIVKTGRRVDYDRDYQNTRAEALIDASSEPVKFKLNKTKSRI